MSHSQDPAEDAAAAILRPGQTTYHVKNINGFEVPAGSVTEMEFKFHTKLLEGILQELQGIKEVLEDISAMR